MDSSARLADEMTLIFAMEELTGHATHEVHNHRRVSAFNVRSSLAWLAAIGIVATLLTGAISQTAESHTQPLTQVLATGQGFTLYNPPTLLPDPPARAPHSGPGIAISIHVVLKPKPPAPTAPSVVPVSQSLTKVQIVIAYALRQQGKRYVWNMAGPNTFDCSGLTLAAYAQVGIHMAHFTGDQMKLGIRVSRAQLRPGDLVFPSDHHVGIYLGDGKAIFAPHSGSVVQIQTLSSYIYTARRILT